MFGLKIVKADGSLIGVYDSQASCLSRLQSISAVRGSDYQIRVRGTVSDIPKTYTGSVIPVSELISDLSY